MARQGRVVNLMSTVAMLTAVLAGVGLLALSAHHDWWEEWFVVLLREVGVFLLVTGVMAVWWERISRRAIAEEILERVGTSQAIARAGLLSITDNFHRDIDWEEHFKAAREITVFFAYGRTWLRHTWRSYVPLQNAAHRFASSFLTRTTTRSCRIWHTDSRWNGQISCGSFVNRPRPYVGCRPERTSRCGTCPTRRFSASISSIELRFWRCTAIVTTNHRSQP